MASVLKDPAVVEHVGKQVEKAVKAERKRLLGELKKFHGTFAGTVEDKGVKKTLATFHKDAQASLAAPF